MRRWPAKVLPSLSCPDETIDSAIRSSFHDLNAFICLLFTRCVVRIPSRDRSREESISKRAVFSSYENNTFKYQSIALELKSLFLCFFLFRLYRRNESVGAVSLAARYGSNPLTWRDCRKKMLTFWPRAEVDHLCRLNKTL